MTPKSFDKSTTTESITASQPEAEVIEPVKSKPQPKAKPMGGMKKAKWAGKDIWTCPRCGFDTFNETDAKVHTCNGRVSKLYEGDDK